MFLGYDILTIYVLNPCSYGVCFFYNQVFGFGNISLKESAFGGERTFPKGLELVGKY